MFRAVCSRSSAICRSEFARHDAGLRDKVIRFSLTLFKCSDLWKINRRNLLTRPSRASNSRHQSFCTVPTRGLSSALDSAKLIGRRYWRPVVGITVFTPIFRQLRVDFSYQTVWLEKKKRSPRPSLRHLIMGWRGELFTFLNKTPLSSAARRWFSLQDD